MQAAHNAQVAFYLTGQQAAGELGSIAELALRPALFAYRSDLTDLRYDFPLVLLGGRSDATSVNALSSMVDGALAKLEDKPEIDRLRHHAHALERELRTLLAERGGSFRLGALRVSAMERLGAGSDSELANSMRVLASALPNDAELVDCDRAMPGRVVAHLWAAAQRPRMEKMRADIDRLALKVAEILDAAQARSDAGRSPEALRAAMGSVHEQVFDFVALSRILGRGVPAVDLPEARWRRLHWLLSVLQSQRFFPDSTAANDARSAPYEFVFSTCDDAVCAWRERLPKAIELVKAMTIADMEITGEYDEARHDAVFDRFGERGLDPAQAARFPSYLVRLDAGQMSASDAALAIEALDAGLPLKVLVQSDDILAPTALGDAMCSIGAVNRQLTGAALAQGTAFVMQASGAQMFACRDKLFAGLAADGPALISVFSGAGGQIEGVAPYLVAAAATESRAFPTFVYDPAAGAGMASRFSLEGNPQADRDWAQHELTYQDAGCQRVQENVCFTLVDLLSCDRRFAADFARVAPAAWNGQMVSVADCMAKPADGTVPYVAMLDADNVLHRVVADERLIRVARRCLGLWRGLQELGGIHNSYADRAVADARAAWEEAAAEAAQAAAMTAAPAAAPAVEAVPGAPIAAPAEAAAEPERSPDEPYIETARCSTCEECVKINAKMFVYNKDKQAYIADVTAGTYRQLVEAAENCQVAVIHPGKPRDPNEPGLEDLIARAAAFQ